MNPLLFERAFDLDDGFLDTLHRQHKLMALKVTLLIAIIFSIFSSALNHGLGNTTLTIVQILGGLVYLLLLILLIRSREILELISPFFILVTCTICIFYYFSITKHYSVFMWSVICYFFAQYFLETKSGMVTGISFLMITLLLLARRYLIDPYTLPVFALINLVIINISALAFSVFYENRRVKAETALKKSNRKLNNMYSLDGLTGLFNRRVFDRVLKKEWLRQKRTKRPISLILSNVDYFKKYNETYGHLAGDDCLKILAEAFMYSVQRVSDITARYDGEEFAVILPNTGTEGAMAIVKSIEERVREKAIPHQASEIADIVTLSFGVATVVPDNTMNPGSFVVMADKALSKSKEDGRNRISVARDSDSENKDGDSTQ